MVQMAAKGAAVVAINKSRDAAVQHNINQSGQGQIKLIWMLAGTLFMAAALPLTAAILPDERIDALFHYYNGGGITVQGPALQASKQIGNHTSLSAKYYVDAISSASIDVVTSASRYTEKREEYSVGTTYLRDKSTLSLNYSNSKENDFIANSANFNISQDMFGDLTTLYMGYSKGWDAIYKTVNTNAGFDRDPSFEKEADRQKFRLGASQIISKNLVTNLNYELITDSGYLNNPYRTVRFSDGSTLAEVYPNTRSSNAIALSANYYLPYRAALHGSYRFYGDTWGISANTLDIGYTHTYRDNWIVGSHYRHYRQNRANFYQDFFDPFAPQNHMARDKELSSYNSQTIGLNISYNVIPQGWRMFDKGTLNFSIDHMRYQYDDFSDLRNPTPSPYGFSANVVQVYMSVWH